MEKLLLIALAVGFGLTFASAGLGLIGAPVAVGIYLLLITLAGAASVYVAENSGDRSRVRNGA
jgi:hypothetical protein